MNVPPAHVDNLLQTAYVNRVPDIFIELPHYKFFHSPNPLDDSLQDDNFIGRKDIQKKLRLILTHSSTKAGAYLITGFRGMGKTSVVRKVIANINKETDKKIYSTKRYEPIEISLAQDDLSEIDVFRLISRHLQNLWQQEKRYYLVKNLKIPANMKLRSRYKAIQQKIDNLNTRINAELSIEKGHLYRFEPKAGIKGMAGQLEGQAGSLQNHENSTASYPIAGAKEVEWILINILRKIQEYREMESEIYKKNGPDLLFIFDELDKIEPYHRSSIAEKETENPLFDEQVFAGGTDKVRRRRETIAQLLANLKNFLNVAPAKFLFIGGREMYDAALADIADRDSFYSSIFHDILYVDSFLKDQAGQYAKGITKMTEMYLSKILLPKYYLEELKKVEVTSEEPFEGENVLSLRSYCMFLYETYLWKEDKGLNGSDSHKALPKKRYIPARRYPDHQLKHFIFLLQNFIIYLVYRSNGTPKKLTGLCEDFMVTGNQDILDHPYHLVIGNQIIENPEVEMNTSGWIFFWKNREQDPEEDVKISEK
ncbi:MAG: ATP-binding protein [Bacteroidota bacterium]